MTCQVDSHCTGNETQEDALQEGNEILAQAFHQSASGRDLCLACLICLFQLHAV